jgi:2-iminobutanoate/2-iminopropanoate deaminase
VSGRSIQVPGLHHGGAPIPIASVRRGILASGRISGHRADASLAPAQDQIGQVFINAGLVLAQAGGSLDDLIRMTFVLADDALRPALNDCWTAIFPDPDDRPTRHISVTPLPPDVVVQCELLAVLPTRPHQES